MARAVIEIGAETTSLLVAEAEDGSLKPLLERRQRLTAMRLGASALTTVIESEADRARQAGADSVVVTVAPELKGSHLYRGLERRLGNAGLGPLQVLTPAERGALSFLAIASERRAADEGVAAADPVAVIEIGATATTLAVGSPPRPRWWASRPLHTDRLRQSLLRSDPPSPGEMQVALEFARQQLATLKPPSCRDAYLGGPDSGLLALLLGDRIDIAACQRASEVLSVQLSEIVAARLGIDPQAAQLLPAMVVIVQAAIELIGQPLRVAHAGVAEGLLLKQDQEVGSHEPA